MSKNKALTENKKLEIAELYNKGELSVGAIAENLGVSLRTIHNYKDHKEELPSESIVEPENKSIKSDRSLDSNEETLSENDHIEEPKRIKFIGGKKFKTEEPEKEEFEHECAECGHEFNEELSNCPGCGVEFDLEDDSENKESIDLGKIALAIGGIATVGYLIHRARSNNQNWSNTSWNGQEPPWINRIFNNQSHVI